MNGGLTLAALNLTLIFKLDVGIVSDFVTLLKDLL